MRYFAALLRNIHDVMLKERWGRLRPLRLKNLNAGVQILRFVTKKLQSCHAEGTALKTAPLFATEESQCWRTDASLRY